MNRRNWGITTALTATALVIAATTSVAAHNSVEITLAHSYTDAQPQAACGAKVIADEARLQTSA